MTAHHAAILRRVAAEAPDRELLGRFVAARDADAFAELVRRYGPAVFGVCLRAVRHRQDAEDAFQAVWLVLARRAGDVRRPELLGNWLYGVAVRVARKARRTAGRRRARESPVTAMPEPPVTPTAPSDLGPVIDEELAALPAWYRDAVLLCDLYDMSRTEAAARLGVPEGTLSSRLAAGRKKLAERLARRGVTATAVGLTVAVPAELAGATVGLAVGALAGGPVAASIEHLAHDGGRAMTKLAALAALAAATVGVAAGAAAWPGQPPEEPAAPAVAAAPDPQKPAEKPAPAKSARAKLVGSLELDGSPEGGVTWSPSGRRILFQCSGQLVVWEEGADHWATPPKRLEKAGRVLGYTRGGEHLLTSVSASGRINAINALFAHDVDRWKPDQSPDLKRHGATVVRVTDLEPDDGHPAVVVRGGKAVLAVKYEMKPNPNFGKKADRTRGPGFGRGGGVPSGMGGSPFNNEPREVIGAVRYRLIDAETGEAGPDIAKVPAPTGTYSPQFVHNHLAGHLIVAFEAGSGFAVEAYELADGQRAWRRLVETKGPAMKYRPVGLMVSPEGGVLAVSYRRVPEPPEPPEPGATPLGAGDRPAEPAGPLHGHFTIDLTTEKQEDGPKVPDFRGSVELGALSYEGRLVAVHRYDSGQQAIEVWDTKTGKLIKSWSGSGAVAFDMGNRLAILESVRQPVGGGSEVFKAVIGVWDLSGLVK